MLTLRQRIQSLLGQNSWRFVFPSEISARHWRHAALRLGKGRAVWGDRFLSWDRFKELAFGLSETRRPVNGIIRTLFAVHMAAENSTSPFLTRLLPADGSEAGGSVRELSRILPRLHTLVPRLEAKQWPLAADLRELHRRYSSFLEKNGLYEPTMLSPSLETLEHSYLLAFPETLEDFNAYRPWIEGHPRIELFSPNGENTIPIELHPNERMEASALFRNIRGLILDGVRPEEIAITLPDIENTRTFIEEAAHRYDIPLEFRTGRGLGEYSGVRFFRSLAELQGSSWEIGALKNLVLNAGVPWKEPEALRRLIRDGIEAYVVRNWRDSDGAHGWEEQLTLAGRKKSLTLYRRLNSALKTATSAGNFSDTAASLQAFIGTFLETSRWREESPIQLKAFQRALEILNDFTRAETGFPELRVPSPYAVWTAAIEEAGYVEQQPRSGIPVYPYRVSAGIFPRYHFLPFLTQESSRIVWDRGFPLNEAQREEAEISDDDVSRVYLRLYLGSGEQVRPSCSRQGYSGPGLPPGLFVENGLEAEAGSEEGLDPETEDELFFREAFVPGSPASSWQQRGFSAFRETGGLARGWSLLDSPIPHAGLAEELKKRYLNNPRRKGISPTALDSFWSCPFAFLFTAILELPEEEYRPLVRDHRMEGILIHRVLEAFCRSLEQKPFLSAETESYRERLRAMLRSEENSMHGPRPLRPAWEASLSLLEELLLLYPEAEAKLFDGFTTALAERTLETEIDGIQVTGRIDRVARGPAGELLIVDYKKGFSLRSSELKGGDRTPATMQLPFYALLLEAVGTLSGKEELISAYYVAADGRYRILSSCRPLGRSRSVLDEEEFRDLMRTTREHLSVMAARIAAGDFRSSSDTCAGCTLRSLCRERYVVRGESR
jgi:RecB family exonuclease